MADLFDLMGNDDDVSNWKEYLPELEKMSGKNLKWLYKCDYRFVGSIDDLYALRDYLVDKTYIALDTETTGVLYLDKTVSVQITAEPGVAYFIPIRMEQCANITPQQFCDVLGPEFQKDTHILLAFNFKFDGLRLASLCSTNHGLYLFSNNIKVIDLQICYKLQDPDNAKLSLKILTTQKLGREQLELEDLFKKVSKKKAVIRFQSLPIVHAIPYSCADTDCTFQIYWKEKDKIDALMQSDQIVQLEHKVQKVIARLEMNGCYINKALLAKANQAANEEIARLDKLIKDLAGPTFQVNSVAQMQEFLYGNGKNSLGLQPVLFTDKGAPAVNKDALAQYKDSVPAVDYILKYKEACKLKSAFLEKIPEYCDAEGRVHPNFNPLGAASGRFTCSDPNFQQLPKMKDSELDFRAAVRNSLQARPGFILFDMDYSQIEYRVFAQLCGDEHLQEAYIKGADFHQATAAIAYKVPYDKVTPLQRKKAKCVSGDTYLFSPQGLIKFKDLSQNRVEDTFDESVSRLVQNDESTVNKALSVYYSGTKPAVKVTLDYGYSLTGSLDKHRVKVINALGFPAFKRLADLNDSDYVLFSRKPITSTTKNYVTYDVECGTNMPKFLNEDIARLWGILLSDGYFAECETSEFCSYTTSDSENFDWFYTIAKKYFGSIVTYSYFTSASKKPYWTVKISSSCVSNFFKQGKETKSTSAHIPQNIFNSPISVQRAFLIGWFNGDGHIKVNSIDSGSISKQMTKDLRSLLLYHGILTAEQTETNKKPSFKGGDSYSKPYYKFTIVTLESRRRFFDFVGKYLISCKAERLSAYLDKTSRSETRGIYLANQQANVSQVFDLLSSFTKDSKNVRKVKNGTLKTLSVNQIKYILRDLEGKDLSASQYLIRDFYKSVIDNDLSTLKVRSIERTEAELFDIFVPVDNTFISGGFISENTINFGLLYGLSTFGLAQKLDCSEAEAGQMMDDYFAEKPRVREWQAEVQEEAVKKKYVKTVFGRRRLLRELYSKDRGVYNSGLRKSVNSTVQGTAADILKIAFCRLQKVIDEKWPEVMMIATVHDEIVFEVPLKYDLRLCFADLKEAMQVQPAGWVVPVVAEPEVGFYWGSLIDIKDFDYDNPESLKDASVEVKAEDTKEKIETLTFILPERMAQISFLKFKKLISDNPGDVEFDLIVGSGQPKRAKSKIAVSRELIDRLEDLYVTVKIPESLLFSL